MPLSLTDLQKLWKVPMSTVLQTTTAPDFPKPIPDQRWVRFRQSDVDDWLEKKKIESEGE